MSCCSVLGTGKRCEPPSPPACMSARPPTLDAPGTYRVQYNAMHVKPRYMAHSTASSGGHSHSVGDAGLRHTWHCRQSKCKEKEAKAKLHGKGLFTASRSEQVRGNKQSMKMRAR